MKTQTKKGTAMSANPAQLINLIRKQDSGIRTFTDEELAAVKYYLQRTALETIQEEVGVEGHELLDAIYEMVQDEETRRGGVCKAERYDHQREGPSSCNVCGCKAETTVKIVVGGRYQTSSLRFCTEHADALRHGIFDITKSLP